LNPPDNAELFETPMSTLWFDENGLLCAVSKKVERTIENYQKVMEFYKEFTKDGNKLCLLLDITNSPSMPMSKEVREYFVIEMPKYIKAHGLITDSPLQSTLAIAFVKLSVQGFPIKLCSNETDGKKWLKEYL
jgi:hypothetical protein